MNKVLFATLAILALCKGQKSYENYKVFRVDVPSQETFDLLSSFSAIHFWNEGRVGSHADVMVAPQNLAEVEYKLKRYNFEFNIMVENVGDLIRLEKVPVSNQREDVNTKHSMDWNEYHSQDDIETYLDYLASTYDFVDVESIGQSYEGRPRQSLDSLAAPSSIQLQLQNWPVMVVL